MIRISSTVEEDFLIFEEKILIFEEVILIFEDTRIYSTLNISGLSHHSHIILLRIDIHWFYAAKLYGTAVTSNTLKVVIRLSVKPQQWTHYISPRETALLQLIED